jgi:hypothetical protein
MITNVPAAQSGRWAVLDDGCYSITVSVMFAGDMVFVGRVAGNELTLENGSNRFRFERVQ